MIRGTRRDIRTPGLAGLLLGLCHEQLLRTERDGHHLEIRMPCPSDISRRYSGSACVNRSSASGSPGPTTDRATTPLGLRQDLVLGQDLLLNLALLRPDYFENTGPLSDETTTHWSTR